MYCVMYTNRFVTSSAAVILWIALLTLNFSGLLSSQRGVMAATLTIVPESSDQPRVGDSVTLDCQLSGVEQSDAILWKKRNATSGNDTQFVDANGLNSNADDRFSLDPLTLVNATGNVYSQKVNINSIRKSDGGMYSCEEDADLANVATAMLEVFLPEEFPVCSPDGQAAVTNGRSLSCRSLTDSRFLSVSVKGMTTPDNEWIKNPSTAGRGAGEELTKTVTVMDNGTIFSCFSLSVASPLALSCTIGPLTVLTSDISGGLSAADIAGIVIGAVVLVVIVALHFLCCRCTPTTWMRTKSYLLDIGSSSFGVSNRRDDTSPEQANAAALRDSHQDDVPPSYESATENNEVDTKKLSAAGGDRDTLLTYEPETVESAQSNQHLNITVEMSVNIAAWDVSSLHKTSFDVGNKPENFKRFAANRKGKVNKSYVPDTGISETSDQNEPKQNPSVIKMAKDSPSSGDGSENPETEHKPKKIKRFAINRKGKVEKVSSPPKPKPVIMYAELDLPVKENDEVRPPKEPKTYYAEIKH